MKERPIKPSEVEPPALKYYGLWKHLYDQHGLILTESELQDIIALAERAGEKD